MLQFYFEHREEFKPLCFWMRVKKSVQKYQNVAIRRYVCKLNKNVSGQAFISCLFGVVASGVGAVPCVRLKIGPLHQLELD